MATGGRLPLVDRAAKMAANVFTNIQHTDAAEGGGSHPRAEFCRVFPEFRSDWSMPWAPGSMTSLITKEVATFFVGVCVRPPPFVVVVVCFLLVRIRFLPSRRRRPFPVFAGKIERMRLGAVPPPPHPASGDATPAPPPGSPLSPVRPTVA